MIPEEEIQTIAIACGATVTGLAATDELLCAPSQPTYRLLRGSEKADCSAGSATVPLPFYAEEKPGKTVLVVGLAHPEHLPSLDWHHNGNTPGNRHLMEILDQCSRTIEQRFSIQSRQLHYCVEHGGVFLKDAAVLAGLGCIGKNNMLITPSCGPRIRLRALLLDKQFSSTGHVDFDPCNDCSAPCRQDCPEGSMNCRKIRPQMQDISILPARDGCYDRNRCYTRMDSDIEYADQQATGDSRVIRYCRRCEFACPVGK